MPPRKVRAGAVSDNQSSSEDEAARPSPVLMSGDQLTSFLAAFAKTQAEVNRQLVESLMTSYARGSSGAPPEVSDAAIASSPTPTSLTSKSGNMAKCTSRFDGQSRDPEVIEAFIDSVEIFKECASISDDLALRGLPMLLHGEAAVWWRGVRTEVSSWPEAVKRLRCMYGIPRPAYKIFRNIFAVEQNEELADSFIIKIRAMMSTLPYVLPEQVKCGVQY
ncbi:activity-regulated cytoskeleton associated protein 2-like [Bombyx mandarina]|uniref:Activity-regulated cytoskeleton associated protein 2-like n=1 Tax=Bombyx mandarina TaxID=7092 RepID=A0A6J2JV63_BOMMA|nr:activity-regulated cytoskeleton associated protein 2-like [Bombyx mandarina]